MTEATKKPDDTGANEAAEFEAAFAATLEGKDYQAPVEEAPAQAATESDSAEEQSEPENPESAQATQTEQDEQSEQEAQAAQVEHDTAEQPENTGLPLDAFDEQTIKTLLAKSSKVDELEQLMARQSQELRRAYGKIGELNSHIKQLMKAPTQRGIKQAEIRFARLEEEYPEIAEMLKEDMAQLLSAAQTEVESGGETPEGQPEAPQEVSQDAVESQQSVPEQDLLAQRELEIRMEYEKKLLGMRHPDWEQVAQSPDFQIWLASQPPQVQQIARTSWSAEELSAVFDLYKSASQVMAQKARQTEVKQKRLESAVPVSNNGSAAPPVADEVDDFLAGFESVMKQRVM